VICSIRSREQVKKLPHARIDCDGNTRARRCVTAGRRVAVRRQQTFMRKRVRHCGDCGGCSYFPESLIVRVKKRATAHQRTANSSTELVADKRWNWSAT